MGAIALVTLVKHLHDGALRGLPETILADARSHAFEDQDLCDLIEALAKLRHPRDIWAAGPLFAVIEEKDDRERGVRNVGTLHAGAFYRLRPHFVGTSRRQMEEPVEESHADVVTQEEQGAGYRHRDGSTEAMDERRLVSLTAAGPLPAQP